MEKEDADNVSIKPQHGNSLAYTLDRLKREREDLYKRVIAKEISANAAAVEAGWRNLPFTLHSRELHQSVARDPRDAGGLATGYQCSIRGTLTVAPLGRLRHPLQLVADVRPASYFPSVENSSAPRPRTSAAASRRLCASGQRGSCPRPGRGA